MKYVILAVDEQDLGFTRVYPFIFPEYVVHSNMAEHMMHLLAMEEDKDAKVLSAGFCSLHDNQWRCTHGSESLAIKSERRCELRDERLLNLPNAQQGICFNGVEHA